MKAVDLPSNENERLKALKRYDILDTPAETAFDALTQRAARVQHYEINEYTEAGALGTIQKPFDPLKLPQAILYIFNKPNKAETNDTQSKETI
jgi:hypothetical protein